MSGHKLKTNWENFLSKNKSIERWIVVLGAVLLQVCLGAIYTWSLFNQPLIDKFGWDLDATVRTYSIAIAVFAFTTIFSGRLQDKIGPRLVATIGAVCYGAGLILTSMVTELWQLYLCYSVLGGIGVGFAYVCPLATCVKWFPKKKGFITGIAVGAFGLGSFVFKSIIINLINSVGVSQTFLYIGIIYLVVGGTGAQLLKLPTCETLISAANPSHKKNFRIREMIRTKSFYLLFMMYLFACISGLLVIGYAKDIGVELAGLSIAVAANTVAIIALFNAGGRLIWGTLSDKIGRERALFLMFIITTISMVVLAFLELHLFSYFASVSAIAFCFGGFLAVFPTVTSDYYGIKTMGKNYGIIYQAYGIAALLGPNIKHAVGDYTTTFIIAGVTAFIGAFLTLFVRSPQKK